MTILLFRLLATAISLLVAAQIIPGVHVADGYTAVITAALLGLLNLTVRPILVFLTLPITIFSLGLFLFVINAGLLLFLASFVRGFVIDSVPAALAAAILISVVHAIAVRILPR